MIAIVISILCIVYVLYLLATLSTLYLHCIYLSTYLDVLKLLTVFMIVQDYCYLRYL